MGYYKDSRGVENFEPDNTEDTLYLMSCGGMWSMQDIIDRAKEYFKIEIVDLNKLTIESERIHTDSIGYDLYVPSDYTNYIVITYTPYTKE